MKPIVLAASMIAATASPALAATQVETQITVEAAIFGFVIFGALGGVMTRRFWGALFAGVVGALIGAGLAQM